MGLILDTSAIIAIERSQASGSPILLDPDAILCIPAIIWAEALVVFAWPLLSTKPPAAWRDWRPFAG